MDFEQGRIQSYFGSRVYGAPDDLEQVIKGVLERSMTVTGSSDYADQANRFNDENAFFIHNPEIAEYLTAEIERIYAELDEDFPA